ncbi:rhomboid family intramembrane serine protease [Hymenobacter sp. BT664]|uniref:Rhomboid family intramembrane serine protease n=1 Tax=Hymenobacter montanus TaxID=2771359 RepID=A0A927GHJ1_9BACT|nr:rhomboid family intramembrane serine protease [Hymenobacter montanus]MBD2766377.1 rhomboid family intramembrane serine protease [Hymenobacter montanus]
MFNLTPTVRNLLIVNVAFFLAQMSLLPLITQVGSLYAIGSPYFYPWQFFTYMFLHGGWGHLISNMFGLISFGPLLEQRWGPARFLTFWMICGVGAGLLYEGVRSYELYKVEQARQEFHQSPSGADFANFFRDYFPEAMGYETLAAALQRNPQNQEYIDAATAAIDGAVTSTRDSRNSGMLGASGALFGILFAFAYLFPNTELMLLFFPFPIKAKYFVFLYSLYELYKGVHRTPGDNVAHFAHLGGLLIGFIILRFWERDREKFY